MAIALLASLCATCGYGADAADDLALAAAVRAAVDEVAPSVLRIETFGGLEKVGGVLVGSGPSTGVAVSEDGYVLCSAYTFARQPTSILVTMPSGKRVAAKVVARDHSRMLVLLKANSDEPLQVPTALAREEMNVGQTAIALGRTFDVKSPNVSVGILSATNRVWGKAIQTDAKISPSNYGGPLIDLNGRVLGILVPMSPQGEGALAGAEWYDSGIGFAAPLAEVLPHLKALQQGHDLYPGKLGVSLAGRNQFAEPVEIAAVLPGSPAAKAGLKKGDILVEADGRKVRWLTHLKHALGPHYAGDSLAVAVKRDGMLIETKVELVGEVAPYDVPFLGILPTRDFDGEGAQVRFIYPGGPAEKAGVKPGDVIQSFAGGKVKSADALRDMVGTHDSATGEKIEITILRDGKTQQLAATLGSLPEDIPGELPPARKALPAAAERPPVGLTEVQVPEIANEAWALIPDSYHPDVACGLVVWLDAPGEFDKEKFADRWRDLCKAHDLIVLAPQAAKDDAWQPTEAEFARKCIDQLRDTYNIDPQRIAVGGYQAGGTFAALVAFANAEIVRGVALVDAALPSRAAPPASDPVNRVAFYIASADESKLKERIDANVTKLRNGKLPVSFTPLGAAPRQLSDEERAAFVRWVDALDRI